MTTEGGLERIWNFLDEAYGEHAEEEFERTQEEFLAHKRTPGTSISTYLANPLKML